MKSRLLFCCLLIGTTLFAQPTIYAPVELSSLTEEQLVNARRGSSTSRMMCTASPGLTISCVIDDRDDPGATTATPATIEISINGGVGPIINIDIIYDDPAIGGLVIVSGGSPDLTYNPATGRDFTIGLATVSGVCITGGPVSIVVTDSEGCMQTCTGNINPTCNNFSISGTVIQPQTCDEPTGSITTGIDPGSQPYCPNDNGAGSQVSYEWETDEDNDGFPDGNVISTDPDLFNVPAGTYWLNVTDFYGCTGGSPFQYEIVALSVLDIECNDIVTNSPSVIGGNDGSMTFTITTGSPPYEIEVTNFNTGNSETIIFNTNNINLTGLSMGDHFLFVTDDNACTNSCEVTIMDPQCSLSSFSCSTAGQDSGNVALDINGGSTPYQVTYSGASSGTESTSDPDFVLTGLSSGNYTITVRDAIGCERSCATTIVNCTAAVLDGPVTTNINCAGSLTGAIDLNLVAGSPTYAYAWTGPDGFTASTQDIGSLAAGNYSVVVTGTAGCSTSSNFAFTITTPDSLEINCSATQASFMTNDGTISAVVSGGTPPYRFTYNGTNVDGYVSGTAIENLAPAIYNITVTDANMCEQTCMVEVTQVDCQLTVVPSSTNPLCPGDSTGVIMVDIMNATGSPSISWSVPGFDNLTSVTGLPAGSYWAIVGDDICTLDTIRFLSSDPTAIEVTLMQGDLIQCHGDSTASLSASVDNAVGIIAYNWIGTTFPDAATATSVPAGTYILEVTDGNGCTGRDTLIVGQPADLTLSCSPSQESISGANDGSIALNFTGAAPFQISNDLSASGLTLADSPFTFNGLAPGTYNLIITDANGCTETCTAVVNEGGCIMTLDTITTGFDCNDPMTGSIIVTPINGTAPFSYAWTGNTSSTDSIANGLTAGQYTVIVTDANNCTAQFDTTFINYAEYPEYTFIRADSICDNSCQQFIYSAAGEGQIEIRANLINLTDNSTAGFLVLPINATLVDTFEICPSDFGLTSFQGYQFNFDRVQDEACFASLDIDVTPSFFPLATDTIRQDFCNGDMPMFGGQVFDMNNTSDEILLPGASVNGCDSLLVVDLSFFGVIPSTIDSAVCIGNSINIEGEVFDAARPTGTFTSMTPSSLGCDSSITVNLTFHPVAERTIDTLICPNSSVTIEGNVFDGTNNGSSFVSATPSANGCDSTVIVNVMFRAPVTASVDTLLCDGSFITIEGVVYDASNNGTSFVSATPSVDGCDSTVTVNLTFRQPVTGTYNELVCDGGSTTIEGVVYDASNNGTSFVSATPSVDGCDSTVTVNLTFREPITGTYNELICDGGSTTIEGVVYDASNNGTSFVSATPSVDGCDSTVTVNLTFREPVTSVYNELVCDGGSTTIEGVVYDASNNGTSFVSATPSVDGCDSTVTVNLTFREPVTSVYNELVCDGGSTTIEGVVYDASNNGTSFVSATPSVDGCDSTVTVNLTFREPITGTYNELICDGGSTTIEGVVYDASNNGTSFVSATPSVDGCDSTVTVNLTFREPITGTYNELVCDGGSTTIEGVVYDASNNGTSFVSATPSVDGCDSTVTVNLTFREPITGTYNELVCDGGSTTIEGVVYDASNNGTSFVSATPSVDGCDSTVTVNLTFREPITGTYNELICDGGSTTIEGVVYDASNNGTSFVSATPSVDGCDSTVTVNLTFKPREQLALVGIEGGCGTDTYTLVFEYSGSDDVTMLLENTAGIIYDLPFGQTRIDVIATGGDISIIQAGEANTEVICELDVTGVVSLPQLPVLSVEVLSGDADNAISCFGANDGHLSAQLVGQDSGDYALSWDNGVVGSENINLSPGTYTVTADNGAGCMVEATVEVTQPTPLVFSVSTEPADCLGNLAVISIDTITGGSPSYLYSIDDGAFVPQTAFPQSFSALAGTRTIKIQDINGCEVETEVTLSEAQQGQVVISPTNIVLPLGDSVQLVGQTNLVPVSITWTPRMDADTVQRLNYFVSPTENTTYTLVVVDAQGCSATAEVAIQVDRRVPIFAPSAFSPNGDGINDEFAVYGNRGIIAFRDLMIFNRWGESVYSANGELSTTSTDWYWDGTHRGEVLNPEVFIYQITAILADGREELIRGEVVLLR